MTTFPADEKNLQRLLKVLSDGQFHSGQELGDQLGVSRTAVWKQLRKLEALGLTLTSSRGRGYCLDGGLELLNQADIERGLPPESLDCLDELEVLTVTESTNTYVLSKGQGRYACLAEQQTAGRGRRGREWISPFARNLYLSLGWHFASGAAALEGLSLAVGVGLVRALASMGVEDLELKWPNDLLSDGRKLAGILLEMSGDPAGDCQLVVGVGLNVQMPASAGNQIDQPWVDLQQLTREAGAPPVSRNQLAAAFIAELVPILENYPESGFEPYRDAWMSLDALSGQAVEVDAGRRRMIGRAQGVNQQGALCLEVDGRQHQLYGGEVSLRAKS